MTGMIFNATNLFIVLIVVFVLYTLWKPFIRGKEVDAIVDGYVHPDDESGVEAKWCVRFMYRTQKAGKRIYVESNRRFDFREEAKKEYAKGTQVKIRVYEENKKAVAVVTSDGQDKKSAINYTLITVVGGIALAVGYQLFLYMQG